jgi:hypothetical protein
MEPLVRDHGLVDGNERLARCVDVPGIAAQLPRFAR